MSNVLVLHAAEPGFIIGTPNGPPNPPGVITKHKYMRQPSTKPGMILKQIKITLIEK